MKAILYFSLAIIFYCSCNNAGDTKKADLTGTKSDKVSAEIDGKEWKGTNAYFSKQNEKITITLMSEAGNNLIFSIDGAKNGTYDLNTESNSASLLTDEFNCKSKNGKIIITAIDDTKISGSFEFIAQNTVDSAKTITVSKGFFNDIAIETDKVSDQISFERSQVMIVDGENGTVKKEQANIEVLYYENMISFKYKENKDKSFTVKIKNLTKNGGNIVLTPDDSNIENITIDAINKNQTTVWYKNGNTTTFF